jgi:alpha-tubulin suppressor-like RCC1 family protein
VQVSAGYEHTCALKATGAVDCWGQNTLGQATNQAGPYVEVAAGAYHTCALKATGGIDCWGLNDNGQATGQTGPYTPTQVTLGTFHTCVLKATGDVDCFGDDTSGQAADQPGPYLQVSALLDHTCGLEANGDIHCWGNNDTGQATDRTGPYRQVSAGVLHTCALKANGDVDCWGDNTFGEATNQTGPYRQVSAGGGHTCALKANGDIDCWGDNGLGQGADQTGPYVQVSASNFHTCALRANGDVHCWGYNSSGQSADQTGPYVQVSAGGFHTCALKANGDVDCWGQNTFGQATDQTGPYLQVSGGYYHTCAVKANGDVACWGDNSRGQSAPLSDTDTCPTTFAFDFSGSQYANCFRDVLRGDQINAGLDVGGTNHDSLVFTGSVGSAGATWLTVYDSTPLTPAPGPTFSAQTLCVDVLVHRFNNVKGAGVVALLNEGAGQRGLALMVSDAGNTDVLRLATVEGDPVKQGKLTTLTSVSLQGGVGLHSWYRLVMTVDPTTPSVTGKLFRHIEPADPDSALSAQVGTTLTYRPAALPNGVSSSGGNGILAQAVSAVVDLSITNFSNDPARCLPPQE